MKLQESGLIHLKERPERGGYVLTRSPKGLGATATTNKWYSYCHRTTFPEQYPDVLRRGRPVVRKDRRSDALIISLNIYQFSRKVGVYVVKQILPICTVRSSAALNVATDPRHSIYPRTLVNKRSGSSCFVHLSDPRHQLPESPNSPREDRTCHTFGHAFCSRSNRGP